jgi:prolyl-tRNA synthetase
MPMLIPESFLEKEKKHIEGFAPEVYTVTKIGKKELKENLIIRPTSETLFAYYFKQRLQSYKQLPLILNQ